MADDRTLKPDPNLKGSYYRRIEDIQRGLDALQVQSLPPAVQFATYFFGAEKLARAAVGVHGKINADAAFSPRMGLFLSQVQSAVRGLQLSLPDETVDFLFAAYDELHMLSGYGKPYSESARVIRNRMVHHFGPSNVVDVEKAAPFFVPLMRDFLSAATDILKYQERNFSHIA